MSLELLKKLKGKMKHNHRLAPNERIIKNAGIVEDTRDFFYTDGHPVEKGTPYHIHIDDFQKAETYMTGETMEAKSVEIYRRNGSTLFGQYKKVKPKRTKQEYLQPYKWEIKKKDITRGYSKRFFAKENFGDKTIIEVSEKDGKGGSKLYQIINMKWFLGYDKALIEFQNLLSLAFAKKNGFFLYDTISPLSGYLGSENPLLDKAEQLNSTGDTSPSPQISGNKGSGKSNMTATSPSNSGGNNAY